MVHAGRGIPALGRDAVALARRHPGARIVLAHAGISDLSWIWAEARGLPNLHTTLDAVPELITAEAMELFSHYGVFNEREMHSRFDIALEHYILSIGVEARATLEIANTVEPIQDGRIHIEKINGPFLFKEGGSPAEYGAGLELAIAKGWLWRHESGVYVKFTEAGADLFA